MSRHVVFGTGQIGRVIVEQLVAAGQQVAAVNRSGRGDHPGAELSGRTRPIRPSRRRCAPAPTSSTSA